MASPSSLFSLLFLLTLAAASSSTNTKSNTSISLPLSPLISRSTPNTNPWQRINHLASSSITRAHHLKHPHKNMSSLTKIPLAPHSYGGYSVSLSFGTPPQSLPFVMDTGSSLVWFPCTKHYVCSKCNFRKVNPAKISTFIPKLSSTAKILGCKNPKCQWVFGPSVRSQCRDCDDNSGNCTQICPPYAIQYGSGTTSGILLSETLELPGKTVKDFIVGCSVFSTRQPSGIAGFGRGPESLPSQIRLKRFSYCLVSHQFDDTPEKSDMVLAGGSTSGGGKTSGLSYTPFLTNTLTSNLAFRDYYYLHLRKITVGGKHVKVPYSFLVPGSDGNGGTMIDSGTTFTFMERKAFEAVAREFEKQMAHNSRAADVEKQSGLRPCFNISGDSSKVLFPDLVFHFKGGAKMALPLADYFSFLGDSGVACMTIVTDAAAESVAARGGPSIILGNFQQQDFYLEYDLENERLGFRKQICK